MIKLPALQVNSAFPYSLTVVEVGVEDNRVSVGGLGMLFEGHWTASGLVTNKVFSPVCFSIMNAKGQYVKNLAYAIRLDSSKPFQQATLRSYICLFQVHFPLLWLKAFSTYKLKR